MKKKENGERKNDKNDEMKDEKGAIEKNGEKKDKKK